MYIQVLGSGCGSGFPAWNQASDWAVRARANDPCVPYRQGAALAVSVDGRRYSLLEAPFHLHSTLTRLEPFAPAPGSRAAPIDSVVLSSAELEACAGALALRTGLSSRIVSSAPVRAGLLDHDAAFRTLEPLWSAFPWDRSFPLDREGQLEARLFPLPAPIPDHLRDLAPKTGRGRCGVRITDRLTGTRLVWAPRMTRLDSAVLAELRSCDVRFVDGTLYRDIEARSFSPGSHSASEIGHIPVDGREGSLATLSGMSGETLYVHIAGTNPLCDIKSEESERVRSAGVEIAQDGMELIR